MFAIIQGDYLKEAELNEDSQGNQMQEAELNDVSLRKKHGIKDYKMDFLLKLANRDEKWLDLEYNNTSIGHRMVQDNPLLAKSLFSLISLEPEALNQYMPKM